MRRPRRTPIFACILAGALVLPSPAFSETFEIDLNGDGTVNAIDLFEFVRQWQRFIELEPTPTPTPRQVGGQPPAGLSDRSNLGPIAVEVLLEDYAKVVHVAETGSDEQGDGSPDTPWRSIPFALEQIEDATESLRCAVLAAEGRYAGETIEVREWVDLYGGFEPVGWTRDFDSHPTVLDGEGERRVVSMAGHTRLDGFTVTGGNTTDYPDYVRGAGVLVSGDKSGIYNCVISGNSSGREGGGILATGDSVVVSNSTIIKNTVNLQGPGIKVSGDNAVISNNYVLGNIGQTGGIHIDGNNPTIFNNVIVKNYARFLGEGGGVRVTGADAKIGNNIIVENDATGGGGVSVIGDNSRTGHNLIVGNRSSGAGGIGGNGTNVSIGGNLILDNSVSQGFNVSPAPSSTHGGGIGFSSKGGLFLGNNIIVGNEVTIQSRLEAWWGVYAIGGGASVNGDGVVFANNVVRGNRGEVGSGIFIRGNDHHFINTIFWDNELRFSDDSNVTSSTFSHCAVVIPKEYDHWTGNLSLDPEFVEPTYVGLIENATFDQETYQSTLFFTEAAEDLSGIVGRVIRIGERYLVVDSSPTSLSLAVWGDVVGLRWPGMEEIEWPAMGYVESFRLQPTSPMRGAGIGPSLQPNVLPYDIDGDPRSGPTCDIGADEDSGK